MKKILVPLLLLSLLLSENILAQTDRRPSIPLKHGAHRIGKRTDADIQRWREHGLGQFIHWGVYAIPGGHWDGKRYGGAAEWIRAWKEMPKEAYDNLYKEFNPTKFDAAHWAKMAKDMGARYMIITTKHHDGFCLWDSKYTDYTIANTPYKKDILKELVKAYQKEGIDIHLYFSIIDWNHPGYRSTIKSEEDSIAYEEFKTFTRNQLLELLNEYPQTKGLWFDGTWDKAWVAQAEFADKLDAELREMCPGLIIGSRFRPDDYGKRGHDTNGDLIGDYDQSWERDLPDTIEDLNGNDWDCVMTIPENQWGYHSDWSQGYVKTSYNLIEMMMKAVSLGGNFVLNFGPDGQGAIRPEETQLAKEIGEWMKVNKEAVYGCEYIPLKKQDWGYYTRKGNKIYLSVFNRPLDNKLRIEIPKDSFTPEKAYFLENNNAVEIINGGRNKKNNSLYYISVPDTYKAIKPFVIILEIQDKPDNTEKYQQAHT